MKRLIFYLIVLTAGFSLFSRLKPEQKIDPSLSWFLEKQIQEDLEGKTFNAKAIESSWDQLKDEPLFLRCKVIKKKLYIQAAKETKNNARYWIVRHALETFIKAKQITSLDCIICLRDCFDGIQNSVPIFTFSANKKAINVALIPDCEALNPIDRRYLIQAIQKASLMHPWSSKKATIFWRGTPTGEDETARITARSWINPRHQLVQMSLNHPAWINAEFTYTYRASDYQKNEQGLPPVSSPVYWEKILPVSKPVHPKAHLLYRYLIDIDGYSSCFSRTFWILLSNSILLKQVTDNRQWFYQGLEPYVHFIPLESDLSNLEEQYKWCLEREQECRRISKEASQFALNYLTYEKNMGYLLRLLKVYRSLYGDEPNLTEADESDKAYYIKYTWHKLKRYIKKWTHLPVASGCPA
jgi:hypothetical protein